VDIRQLGRFAQIDMCREVEGADFRAAVDLSARCQSDLRSAIGKHHGVLDSFRRHSPATTFEKIVRTFASRAFT
jgi:hypothetical protein